MESEFGTLAPHSAKPLRFANNHLEWIAKGKCIPKKRLIFQSISFLLNPGEFPEYLLR